MHDLDRQQLEQYEDEAAFGETTGELSEAQELELASEFLEVSSEEELEEFLGDLWNRTKSVASQVYNSGAVQSALPALKAAGRGFLPIAAGKLADAYFPGSGGMVQAGAQGLADQLLNEELEGLSAEDRELALARRYVRFAHDALQRAAAVPERVPSAVAGQIAVADAARDNVPGLVPFLARANGAGTSNGDRGAGRWVRRGSTIEIELG